MALKYFIEYTNVGGHLIRVEIDDPDFVGAATQVKGSCTHVYEEAEDPTVVFRGSYLKLRLEASQGQDFLDLFTEVERIIKVTAFRDSSTFFVGWINPDGIFYDFVNQQWDIEFECSDGLGYLENLAYTDSSGNFYSGIETIDIILDRALARTGLVLPINYVNALAILDDPFLGLTSDYFLTLKLEQELFLRDDRSEADNCREVIEKILRSANSYIIQKDGEWWIVRSNTLNDRYNTDPNTITTIGSEINGFSLFHCNENQRIEIRPSVDSVRNEFDRGVFSSLIQNPDLINDGATISGWTILDPTYISSINSADSSVTIIHEFPVEEVLENNSLPQVRQGDSVSVTFTFQNTDPQLYILFRLSISDGIDTFIWSGDGSNWSTTTNELATFLVNSSGGLDTITFTAKTTAPITGDLNFKLLTPSQSPSIGPTTFYRISVSTKAEQNATGTVWTGFQNPSRSSFVLDNIETFIGNQGQDGIGSVSDLYKNNGIDPAEPDFINENSNAQVDINRFVVEDIILLMQKPSKVFTGDVFGFVNYVQNIEIDSVPGIFHVIGMSYNSITDVTSLKLYEVHALNGSGYSNIDSEFSINFGDNPKPTIR